MIKRVIVNCDDFGLTENMCNGIIKAYTKGSITSTTIMMNEPFAPSAVKILKEHPGLGKGVHLNVTHGKPLTKCSSLIKEDGTFKNVADYREHPEQFDNGEVYQEYKAQMERYIELMGEMPDHIDTHHNIHLYLPSPYKRIAREYHLPVREFQGIIDQSHFLPVYYFIKPSLSMLDHVCSMYEGDLELMVHPAIVDDELRRISSYNDERGKELAFWLSKEAADYFKTHHIQLISFKDL